MANEKRLIDANALIEALPIVTEDRKITLYGAVADFMIMISAMPTVDAVEVVFCDECTNHGQCIPEDTFRLLRIEKPFCCVGSRKKNYKGRIYFDIERCGDGNG